MTFRDPILGGNVLVRTAMQSANYAAGSAGWRIGRDGTVEFNSGTFRGSLSAGTNPGQHFIVNNSTTGDPLDIYDSSNRLIFSIDASGRLTSYSPGSLGDPYIRLTAGQEQFNNASGFTTIDPPSVSAPTITSSSTALQLYSGTPDGGLGSSVLSLFGGTSAASAEARMTQREVTGDVLQLDTSNNNQQLVHVATYTVTTDAGGTSTFNHGAAFTPAQGFLVGVNGVGANFPYQYAWFPSPFTSATAKAAFKDNLGAALANTTLGVMGLFFG
jgi:hypothetical protein